MTVNQRNRRNNITLEYNGKSMTISEWAKETSILPCTLWWRLKRKGWSVEKSLTTPLGVTSKYRK